MARVDVVVVTYNSREDARSCLEELCDDSRLQVIAVDNASTDGTADALADLPLLLIRNEENVGFAGGCNAGWPSGESPAVLFLNPDARIAAGDVLGLAEVLESESSIGAVGPRIVDEDGSLQLSQRRFPTPVSTFGRALFLHRALPRTRLSYDIADPAAYEKTASPDWLSGACILVRRSLLEELGGFDERFFMYCEDMDLCKRIRLRGYGVRYVPSVVVTHMGGASAPRARMVATMMRSRLLYAAKHHSRLAYELERAAIALDGVVHAVLTTQGAEARRGYLRAAASALRGVT